MKHPRPSLFAMAVILSAGMASAPVADAELLRLGREFLRLANQLDAEIDNGSPEDL
jgi:hypothetical protein